MFDATILTGSVRASTLEMYSRDFRAYLEFAGSFDNALQFTTFGRWKAHMLNDAKLAAKTINRMLNSVRSIVREAAAQGYIDKSVWLDFTFVRSVKERALADRERENNRVYISPAQMRMIIETPDTNTALGIRDRAMMLTMASCGCRISEVLNMQVTDIENDGTNYYFEVLGKTDVDPRVVPLSHEAKAAIDDWLYIREVDSDYIWTSFGGRGGRFTDNVMTTVAAWYMVRRYAEECGIENVKPHDFRRFVATQLAKTNIRHAQKVLGHSSIEATARNYVLDSTPLGVTENLC